MSKKHRNRKRTLHMIPRTVKPGAPPGTLAPRADADTPEVSVLGFGPDGLAEEAGVADAEIGDWLARWPTTWVNVDGLGDPAVMRALAERFGVHPLALEDVVNLGQRPKVETYGDQLFVVVRMARAGRPRTEQLSLILGPGFLLTFQEELGDCLDPVRERLRTGRGRIRTAGADYLAYALLDAVVDQYFPILEDYGERLESLQDRVFRNPERALIEEIQQVKQEFMALRRAIWPMRELFTALVRDDTDLIDDDTRLYLRDCYDHVIQLMDVVESYRELASSLVDAYLSAVSFRSNEVMKVLTIVGAIFIPLTFIAGIYGMNFDPEASPWNMPELGWAYGYPAALGAMLAVAGGLVAFFLSKGWIGGGARRAGGGAES